MTYNFGVVRLEHSVKIETFLSGLIVVDGGRAEMCVIKGW